jgi:FixJ family two-component response regulator
MGAPLTWLDCLTSEAPTQWVTLGSCISWTMIPAVRRAFERLLRSAGYAVAVYPSTVEFERRSGADLPGCLLLDLRLPRVSGLELLQALDRQESSLGVLLISGYGDVPTTVKAMRLGVIDVLTKPVEDERLLQAVALALAQSAARWRARLERIAACQRFEQLTPRERQVCDLVTTGLLNKQIANELGTTEKTVKVHRARVMNKLEVGSVAELVRFVDRVQRPHH